jgi:hypothetical protein
VLSKIAGIGRLLAYYLIIIVALDLALGFLGFGYPRHYREESVDRTPSPYDSFAPAPGLADHNSFGFRGAFVSPENVPSDTYTIAFFGGSTGYEDDPPIINMIESNLDDIGIESIVYNFSSTSSNHSQHVHRLVKFIDKFEFDFVIFYGGFNESILHSIYDPRPGYPYNFFYRNELGGVQRFFVETSSIIGEIDKHTQIITGLERLRNEVVEDEDQWVKDIVANYRRDLDLASRISERVATPNKCRATTFISFLQPANLKRPLAQKLWTAMKGLSKERERDPGNLHFDLTLLEQDPAIEFTDIVHVTQPSREKIASKISELITPIIKECQGQ